MARKAEVRYWDSRKGYCCWHNGGQVLLAKGPKDEPTGPTYLAAVKKFARLKSGSHGTTLAALIDEYLLWVKKHREPSTAAIREQRLLQVKAALGEECAVSLTTIGVQKWIDEQQEEKGWSENTARLTLVCLRAALNWAAEGKLIPSHPLLKMELPEEESRGLECVLSPEQEGCVIDACKWEDERRFVQALRDTGARPSEIGQAEAKHYDPAIRALVYESRVRKGQKRHKTRRTGKARVIYLRGKTLALIEQLLKDNPTGPLFPRFRRKWAGSQSGERLRWHKEAILYLFARIREDTETPCLIPYSFRHTFAVRWLRARKPIEALAEVLGTSITMIQRHYGHLADQHDYLRLLVDELDGPAGVG